MDNLSALVIKNCQISSSQEEILNDHPFDGDPLNPAGDGVPPTLPETAPDAGEDRGFRDIFVTPPMNQSYALDFRPCVSHKSVQTDDETQDFHDFTGNPDEASCVDLSDDSDFRFLLAELNQMGDPTMVASCSRRNDGPVIEVSSHKRDKLHVSGRELFPEDSTGEPPHKIMKTSEENLGSKSSQAVEENLGSHATRSEIARSAEERCENGEADKLECIGERDNHDDEIAETSDKRRGDEPLKLRIMLPPSMLASLKERAEGIKENGKAHSFVFDVFRCLTRETSNKDNVEDVDWLELAKFKGITFPTPWWWKEAND